VDWRLHRRFLKLRRPPVDLTDARPAKDPRRSADDDPEVERKRKLGLRAFGILLGLICAAGVFASIFGQGGYLEIRRLRRDISALRSDVESRRLAVRALEDERDRMQADPLAKERIAREQLGLTRKGEIDFLLPRERADVDRRLGS
jgi:cell division protein FtsB